LVVPVLLLFLGCSGSEDQTPAHPPRTVVTVFEGQSTSDPGIEDLINALVAKTLPDLELRWEVMGWGEKFEALVHAKFASGEVPDIMIGKAQDVATYVPSGNLAPLNGELLQAVQPEALPSVTLDNQAYGLPYNAFFQGVLYDKALFRREGLSVPKTAAEMRDLVARLRAKGIVPFAGNLLENWYVGNIFMQFAIGELLGRSPGWGDRFRAGRVSFADSKELARCFSQVKLIFDNTWSDAVSIDSTECDQRFSQGKAAMYVTGSWTLHNVNAMDRHLDLGIFPFPNAAGDARLIFEPNITFMKSSKATNPEAVDRVLRVIFENTDLASRISEFTKTSSLLTVKVPEEPLLIQEDLDLYRKESRIVDATLGNSQLIWSFQAQVANRLQDWIQGKIRLADVTGWADRNRSLSAP
jgi:ABC-type glycerol-3-phosphate transport system substrate-binding protein